MTHPTQGFGLSADPIKLIPKRHHFGGKFLEFVQTLHFRLAVGGPGGGREGEDLVRNIELRWSPCPVQPL